MPVFGGFHLVVLDDLQAGEETREERNRRLHLFAVKVNFSPVAETSAAGTVRVSAADNTSIKNPKRHKSDKA
ncbi:MAG: hypothetical protein IJC66_05485 [Kiritimatiellae bacterium]|nr:hypothetical protein [Kiritimatiellia bacterium]